MGRSRIARALSALAFLVFIGQATGAWAFVAERVCEQYCPDEPSDRCDPGCGDCACCGLARVIVQPPMLEPAAAAPPAVVHTGIGAPPASIDPQEVFHVPISPLA